MALGERTADLFERLYAMNDGRPFEPTAYFDPEMDQLIYLRTNESYRASRVDEYLTLLWNAQEMTLVGIKLKGFRSLFDDLKARGIVDEVHFIPLCRVVSEVLHIAMGESQGDGYRAKLYRQAEVVVGDYRYDPRNLLAA